MDRKQNKISISEIFIKKCHSDLFGSSVRLCAMVTMKDPNTGKWEERECFFEFEERYGQYICAKRSDAFVLGLLTCALETGSDIEYTQPISERLYYQLTEHYIPMLAKYNGSFPIYSIRLFGPLDKNKIQNESAVATGCSGGVDSFYTIRKYLADDMMDANRLTHIVFSSSGTLDYDKIRIKSTYKKIMSRVKDIATECGVDYIWCFNNLHTFYKRPYKGFSMFYTTTYASVAFALQRLISVYYVSSGDPITNFSIDISKADGHDGQVLDVFTVSNLNTENMSIYSSGAECSRIDKEKYIADYIPAQKFLSVCAREYLGAELKGDSLNCSRCPKCLRTMTQFYALGVLDNFREVFDVDSFTRSKGKKVGEMMTMNKSSYVRDMKKTAKERGISIPIDAYLYEAFWYKPLKLIRKLFRDSVVARKLYYRFKIDYLLDGYRSANYEIYKKYFYEEKRGNDQKNSEKDINGGGGVKSSLLKAPISSKLIKISNIRVESEKEFCYLCADICKEDIVKKVWYQVPKQYEEYICDERSDAFLVGILYYAMIYGYDIETEKPVSGRLLYQLERYYIPTLVDTTDFFHGIKIYAPIDNSPILNAGAVGTALSCGVDSFYSALKTLSSSYEQGKLTHVVFTDIPATVFSEGLKIRWAEENRNKIKRIAAELNCKLVMITTNINKDFRIKSFKSKSGFSVANEGLASLQYCSCIFVLQKLFSVYYLASAGYRLSDVKINDKNYDVLWHDFLSMPLLSTENLTFYSDGLEASRLEKLDYIADFPIVQKNLQVCALPVIKNCGKCEKCIRTMSELYVSDKLDLFNESFPVDEYKRNYIKNMAKVISHKRKPYNQEILLAAKMNKKHIPVSSYPLSIIFRIEDRLRHKFRNISLFRKLYYGLNLDTKKYGVSTKEVRANELLLTEQTPKSKSKV